MDIVVCHEMRAMCPEEIVYAFPSITLADVHAALRSLGLLTSSTSQTVTVP